MSASLVYYQDCPFCHSQDIHPLLVAKDHTVSKENFEIWHCGHCTNRFTQSIPDLHHIAPYYRAESYVSHTDTNKGLINQLYHWVRSYTLGNKRRLIKNISGLKEGSLLDIGAGTGAFAHTMAAAGWKVTALEPDPVARENAANKYGLQLRASEEMYTLPEASFDVITLWHVLEHVHDLHGYFERFKQLLKPHGQLVIAVPNYTSKDATIYGQHWAAWDVPRHLYHFSPKGLQQLAHLKGFDIKEMKPMWFDAFYVSMLSEQYKTGKSNLLAAFWNGLRSNLQVLGDQRKCSSVIYILSRN
jgi:2-polyprenyl-3-methyl-5-hydroxy-6-metoxy-1,4-benzoquinol methylase